MSRSIHPSRKHDRDIFLPNVTGSVPPIHSMKTSQVLASGITIRQDIRDAVRAVLFETGFEGWEYATHGGTLFVVNYQGKVYGVTCAHVLKDFNWNQLVVTDRKTGTGIAGLKTVCYPSSPRDAAVDADILDVAVIEFADDIGPDFPIASARSRTLAHTARSSSTGTTTITATAELASGRRPPWHRCGTDRATRHHARCRVRRPSHPLQGRRSEAAGAPYRRLDQSTEKATNTV
jgi:hypothetical protein